MQLSLLIMAAGMGSRYGGLKQIDHVGPHGETLLEYSIYDAIQAGFNSVTFVIRKDIESAFNQFILPRIQDHISVNFAYQELNSSLPADIDAASLERHKPWGTAHAVLSAKHAITTPFAVINGDDYYGPQAFQLVHDFLSANNHEDQHCLVGYPLEQTLSPHGPVSRGICNIDKNNNLISLDERLKIQKDHQGQILDFHEDGRLFQLLGSEIASMNLWGFNPSIFHHLSHHFSDFLEQHKSNPSPEFQLPVVISSLIDANLASFNTLITRDSWFGITYKDDLQHAQQHVRQLIAQGLYPEKLWS